MSEHSTYEHYPGAPTTPEERPDAPRVYVACLAAYNAGYLHGRWLNAAQDADSLTDAVHQVLVDSPIPGAEEYAIHDFDNFGGYHVGEYDSLAVVSGIARGIAEHGPVFGALADALGAAEDLAARPELFSDWFIGKAATMHDFAAELCDDFGWEDELAKLPASMRPYVHLDYDGLARDLAIELTVIETADGVAVFDSGR